MNNGRFFRLNQRLSRIVEGVAIFDYTELPAYDGKEKPMSPKYPVSLIITTDAVMFRLHYSAYRSKDNKEMLSYGYSIDEITEATEEKKPHNVSDEDTVSKETLGKKEEKPEVTKEIGMAHMGEVFLGLPYTESTTANLTDIIKMAYSSDFPQVIKGQSKSKRFFEQLIEKEINGSKPIDSYSTLWLMDLCNEAGEFDLYDDGYVKKFLRKLLLDFMFDLKHSDVFSVSKDYEQMYSGLMSNFFFSALVHKCEFYYYRVLITQAIDEVEKRKKERNRLSKDKKLQKKEDQEDRDRITYLYAKELFDAQSLWLNDIMDPQAEDCFEHIFPHKSLWKRFKSSLESILFEELYDNKWPSWFATPEEEMRRVHFSMKEKKVHICNARTIVEYLHLDRVDHSFDDVMINTMLESEKENRVLVSRWFLNRYDFGDVMHFHLFKLLNFILLFAAVCFLISLLAGCQIGIDAIKLSFEFVLGNSLNIYHISIVVAVITLAILIVKYYVKNFGTFLTTINNRLYTKRLIEMLTIATLTILYVAKFIHGVNLNHLDAFISNFANWPFKDWLLLILSVIVLAYYVLTLFVRTKKRWKLPAIHPILSSHIVLPKLIASITAAWLTLSTGFDIFVAFFDAPLSWFAIISLTIVVFFFIMSRINRVTPMVESPLKIFRATEFLVISYCISLAIGIVVINFVGEDYLARHGYIREFHKSYIQNLDDNNSPFVVKDDTNNVLHNIIECDSVKTEEIVKTLNYFRFAKDSSDVYLGRLAIKYQIPNSKHDLFILPKFLIMFSFLAMFIGIFLQMVFFDQKQMTDS